MKKTKANLVSKMGVLLILCFAIQSYAQCWKTVSAGSNHSLGIKKDGTLWAWGKNDYGQLGDGTIVNKLVPTQIGNDANWKVISAGYNYSAAIKSDGTLWTWGINEFYQLGDGTTDKSGIPKKISNDTNWETVDAGGFFCVALKREGALNTLWSWGNNFRGQLGNNTTVDVTIPTKIGRSSNWKMISAGLYHVIALELVTGGARLMAWGDNRYNQLGDGTIINKNVPTQVSRDLDWAFVTTGYYHNLALKSTGTLWSWGENTSGELGLGDFTNRSRPTQIGTDTDWDKVASTGNGFTVAKKTNRFMWRWGAAGAQQLGTGSCGEIPFVNYPIEFGLGQWGDVVSSGSTHTIGLRDDVRNANIITDEMYAWGWGRHGQLGNGTSGSLMTTTLIACPTTTIIAAQFKNSESLKSDTKNPDAIFKIFPNPVDDILNLETTENAKIENIIITDITGKTFLEQTQNTNQVDIQKLSKGIYIVTVTIDGLEYQEKIIKK
jgi:alpha-tubulin suppressor-like RCC1 family protein